MFDQANPAWGYGISTIDSATNAVLDTWYPEPILGSPPENFDPYLIPSSLTRKEGEDALRGVHLVGLTTIIDCAAPPHTVADAYLRLPY